MSDTSRAPFGFDGEVAVVTGAAQGIGAAIAEELARNRCGSTAVRPAEHSTKDFSLLWYRSPIPVRLKATLQDRRAIICNPKLHSHQMRKAAGETNH